MAFRNTQQRYKLDWTAIEIDIAAFVVKVWLSYRDLKAWSVFLGLTKLCRVAEEKRHGSTFRATCLAKM